MGRIDDHGLTGKQLSALVDELDDYVTGEAEKGTLTGVEITVTVTRNEEVA